VAAPVAPPAAVQPYRRQVNTTNLAMVKKSVNTRGANKNGTQRKGDVFRPAVVQGPTAPDLNLTGFLSRAARARTPVNRYTPSGPLRSATLRRGREPSPPNQGPSMLKRFGANRKLVLDAALGGPNGLPPTRNRSRKPNFYKP
jgi:hypothetical protein